MVLEEDAKGCLGPSRGVVLMVQPCKGFIFFYVLVCAQNTSSFF